MTIEEARNMLGDLVIDMSDEEVQELIIQTKRMCNLVINHVIKQAKERG